MGVEVKTYDSSTPSRPVKRVAQGVRVMNAQPIVAGGAGYSDWVDTDGFTEIAVNVLVDGTEANDVHIYWEMIQSVDI